MAATAVCRSSVMERFPSKSRKSCSVGLFQPFPSFACEDHIGDLQTPNIRHENRFSFKSNENVIGILFAFIRKTPGERGRGVEHHRRDRVRRQRRRPSSIISRMLAPVGFTLRRNSRMPATISW